LSFRRLARLTCALVITGSVFGLTSAAASAGTLSGAGSTLVAPIEAEWGTTWETATNNTVTYSAVGSGSGEKQIVAGTVDFAGSDAPLSVYNNPSGIVQIPWALSATGVSYRIDGLRLPRGKSLHLTGPALAKIYLGQITNWADPQIKRSNPGARIPSTPINVFWRSDGSGDTYAFTRYLSDVSRTFAGKVGSSTTVSFPVGSGAQKNAGMVQAVQGHNGAIAYIAVSYLINTLPAIGIKNGFGKYTVPNLGAIENAASAVRHVPSSNEVTIVNPPRRARSAYPISTFTYVFVRPHSAQSALLRSFIGFALSRSGQRFGPALDFAPLPTGVLNAAQATLNGI
jgi:phosphate transport system substrate-binding protein